MSATGKRAQSLAAALGKVATQAEPTVQTTPEPTPAAEPEKKISAITMYFLAEDHDRLRDLSHHSKTSLQQLGVEAWNLLLEKRGHAPLKPVTAGRPSGRRK